MEELTCYEKTEKKIGDVFASFGRFVSRHPWEILLVTIFINLALGVGIIKLELLTDIPTVYLPSGTQAWADEEHVRKIFPDLSRSNFQKLQLNSFGKWASMLIRSRVGNILEGNTLAEISSLNGVINNITARTDKETAIRSNSFLRTLKNYSSEKIEVLYAHSESLEEYFHDNILGDLSLFAVTATLMVGYSLLVTVSARITDSVGQRMMLGAAGWFATGLAILSSVGLCAAIGVKFVSAVSASPFLVSGIDDMFILMSGISGAQSQPTISDKLAETMRVSGVGITITTVTDLLAFGCGATSSFLGVKNFCIYTGVAVTFCCINNITMFGACITLNERRMLGNKHWLTCRPIKTKEEAKLEGHTKSYMVCCTGKPPTSRSEAESLLDKFPRWILPKIVLCTPLKIVICFIFMVYFAAAIYGCVHMKQGLRFSELLNDDSYLKEYAVTEEEFFPRQTPVSFVIKSHYNYSSREIKSNIVSFMAKVTYSLSLLI